MESLIVFLTLAFILIFGIITYRMHWKNFKKEQEEFFSTMVQKKARVIGYSGPDPEEFSGNAPDDVPLSGSSIFIGQQTYKSNFACVEIIETKERMSCSFDYLVTPDNTPIGTEVDVVIGVCNGERQVRSLSSMEFYVNPSLIKLIKMFTRKKPNANQMQ